MKKTVLIETSARHIHVSREDLDVLFGKGYQLTPKKDLSQPGQFACQERVTVVGPKKRWPVYRSSEPERPETQLEISLTDARSLGIAPFIRESGDTDGTPGCKVVVTVRRG